MKPWDELTEQGKFRRLRALASNALERYEIAPLRLRFVGGFTNVIFRVDTATGPFALRVDYMQDHSAEALAVELSWLAALAADTDLDVVRVVPARTGEASVLAGAAGVPGERRCVLFRWVPGRPLDEELTPERYRRLGELSAGLHLHGATFDPPHSLMAWDRVFYWPEEYDPVVYHLPEHAGHFSREQREILERTIAAVEPAFGRLDPTEAQIIHGDLHPWNVHRCRSRLIAFDFEDLAWGHRVQDIAITLFYKRDDLRYPELRTAFEEGYRAVAPWPVRYPGELEHFMAARTLMFINFVLNLDEDPADYYATVFPRLGDFLSTWGS